MFFRNEAHARHFISRVKRIPYKCTNEYLCILYLLTADKSLWKIAQKAITSKEIRIDDIDIRGISPMGYILLKTASDIRDRSAYLVLTDLGDKNLISNQAFQLIITALKISRHGYQAIDCTKKRF